MAKIEGDPKLEMEVVTDSLLHRRIFLFHETGHEYIPAEIDEACHEVDGWVCTSNTTWNGKGGGRTFSPVVQLTFFSAFDVVGGLI